MNQTVGEFLNESAHFTKYGKDSCQALEILNKAIRVLWKRGTWQGTIEYLCAKTYQSCFYLPFSSYNIIEARAGKNPVKMETSWFMYIPRNRVVQCCDWDCSRLTISPTGITAALPVKYSCNSRLGFRAENINDIGKKVKITYRSEEVSLKEEEITLADSAVYTEYEVAEVITLNKDRTVGSVKVFANHALNGAKEIHTLHQAETNASYTEYEFTGGSCDNLIIKSKKRRIQLTEDDLNWQIPLDPDALEFAIQAVLAKEKEDMEGYAVAMRLAEEQLQEEQLEMQSQRTSSEPAMPTIVASSNQYNCA